MTGVTLFVFGTFLIWGAVSIMSLVAIELPLNGGDKAFLLLAGFGLICWLVSGVAVRKWHSQAQTPSGRETKNKWADKSFPYLMFVSARLLATFVLAGMALVFFTGIFLPMIWGTAVVMVGLSVAWVWSVRQATQ